MYNPLPWFFIPLSLLALERQAWWQGHQNRGSCWEKSSRETGPRCAGQGMQRQSQVLDWGTEAARPSPVHIGNTVTHGGKAEISPGPVRSQTDGSSPTKMYFFTILEAGEFKINVPINPGSVRVLSSLSTMFLLYFMWQKGFRVSLGPLSQCPHLPNEGSNLWTREPTLSVAHTSSPSMQEAEVRESQVRDQPGLHGEWDTTLGQIVRLTIL